MKKTTCLLLLIFPFIETAQAESLKGGYPACMSEELLTEFSVAYGENERATQYLLNNGCAFPRAGIKVSVLEVSWTGKIKVRAYTSNGAIILWTYTENLQR